MSKGFPTQKSKMSQEEEGEIFQISYLYAEVDIMICKIEENLSKLESFTVHIYLLFEKHLLCFAQFLDGLAGRFDLLLLPTEHFPKETHFEPLPLLVPVTFA